MKPIRVLVVEDSLTVRKHLVQVLASEPGIEVVGEAADGDRGIALCEALRPDVITLDMQMPVLDGLAVTEHVMAYRPTPILIVSASINRAELLKTCDALGAGAVDVLDKPSGGVGDRAWERRFVATVRTVARIRVITHPRARLGRYGQPGGAAPVVRPSRGRPVRAVAVGASTGGPAALLSILTSLPGDFVVPMLIVLHMGEPFGTALGEWLAQHVPFPVRYAQDGDPLPPVGRGAIILAPSGCHMVLQDGCLRLTQDPERHSCRPSIDVLFESVAALGDRAVACLLTGMGRDGAAGLLAISRAGGHTIAQDESTSVVYGMPGEAVRLGAAREVLPLDRIAAVIARSCARETIGEGAS